MSEKCVNNYFNLMAGFLLWRQPCQLRDSNFAATRLAATVQCDFAERELASSARPVMGAAVASGEVAASEQGVENEIYRRGVDQDMPVIV